MGLVILFFLTLLVLVFFLGNIKGIIFVFVYPGLSNCLRCRIFYQQLLVVFFLVIFFFLVRSSFHQIFFSIIR